MAKKISVGSLLKGKPTPLLVRILSPKETIWEGEAIAVAGHNSLGDFSILSQHANFISLIDRSIMIIKTTKERQTFPIQHGMIFCRGNAVQVFTDLPIKQGRGRFWEQLMAGQSRSS